MKSARNNEGRMARTWRRWMMQTQNLKTSAAARTAALTALVEHMAEQFNIRILWTGRKYRAYKKARVVKLPCQKIRTMPQFATALHEFGHIMGKQPKTRMEREYCAWQWAVDNTPLPFDAKAWARLFVSLHSYLLWAIERQHRPTKRPVIPPPSHPMWALIEKARQEGSEAIPALPTPPARLEVAKAGTP